jgi:lysozyme
MKGRRMDRDKIREMIKEHEGFSSTPYMDTEGNLTIGYGRNLEGKGVSQHEAEYLLNGDINDCLYDLMMIFGRFYDFPEDVQHVLVDMRFNLGPGGFRSFKLMISALKDWQFEEAAKEMKDSKWYEQVPNRAKKLVKMMEAV